MPEKTFQITGRIIDSKTKQGIAGLKVEGGDEDYIFTDDGIGQATTNDNGEFTIIFPEKKFRDFYENQYPDLYFKIYHEKKLIKSTEDSVLWDVKSKEKDVGDIEVDFYSEKQVYKVRGLISYSDGTLAIGATVKAFDKALRAETELGSTTTFDTEGNYEIFYNWSGTLKDSPDLQIQLIMYENNKPKKIAESRILYNARKEETINIIVQVPSIRRDPEYLILLNAVTPLLNGISISDLTEYDIRYLSQKTRKSTEYIEYLVNAAQVSTDPGLSQVPAQEILYGLFRQEIPIELTALIKEKTEILEKAFDTALQTNIIAETTQNDWQSFLDCLLMLKVNSEVSRMNGLLDSEIPGQQNDFMQAFLQHEGSIPAFWEELKDNSSFTNKVAAIQQTLQLGILTGAYR